MRWHNDTPPILALVAALLAACDEISQDLDQSDQHPETAAISAPVTSALEPAMDSTPSSVAIAYENEEDYAILQDTSNLRPLDMDENDYRRVLQKGAREELRRSLPNATPPSQADLDLLSLRWFAQGSGLIVQNRSERNFNIAAHFSSSTDSTCEFTVPWKLVGPKASAMYTGKDNECAANRAQVTINDEYGLFVDTVVVQPPEEP